MSGPRILDALEHARRPDGIVRLHMVRVLLDATSEDRAVAADMARATRDEASIARERSLEDEP